MLRVLASRVGPSQPLAPSCLRTLCTQKPAVGSTSKEVAAEPTYKNKDGVATYNYGESLNLPEVTKEQAENAYLEATDVKRAMTPPISVAVEARDDMLKDRFNYVANNLNPNTRAIYAGADGAVEPEVGMTLRTSRVHAPRSPLTPLRPRAAVHFEHELSHRLGDGVDGGHHRRRVHPYAVGRHLAQGAGRQAA